MDGLTTAKEYGDKLLEGGAKIKGQIPRLGEGPMALRGLCLLSSLVLSASAMLTLINPVLLMTHLVEYIICVYLLLFSIISIAMECKDIPALVPVQEFFTEWAKFLTIPGGKGLHYIFLGALALSLYHYNIILFFSGLYMVVMGCLCMVVHIGKRRELNQKIAELYGIDPQNSEAMTSVFQLAQGDTPGSATMRKFYGYQEETYY